MSVEIFVTGPDDSAQDARTLAVGQTVRIGRKPASGWEIPWERQLSREHGDLHWDGTELRFTCLEAARNPAFFRHSPVRELSASIGDEFTIGKARFRVGRAGAAASADAAALTMVGGGVLERILSAEQLSQVAFGNTEKQMETLARLPTIISTAQSDDELAAQLAGLLLQVIPQAQGAAVVRLDPAQFEASEDGPASLPDTALASVKTRGHASDQFRPSRRLTLKTLSEGKSVIHIWQGGEGSQNFTVTEGHDWAFCAPVPGDSCRGWCLYVSGNGTRDGSPLLDDQPLQGDLRFTELVAQFIGSVRQVRLLQQHKTQLSTFFSPNVINSVTGAEAGKALKPAERDISVLFCDVRGFSLKAEEMSHDLLRLLRSVSAVLGVMANGILDRDGTIADFQGDAALGFWGWPVQLETGPLSACRAALDILRGFRAGQEAADSLLNGFDIGVGVAHGLAIAGQIGTDKQAKVGVFGPIVNQGARLEGLTRQFGTPICIDKVTADWVARQMPASEARTRRLARVRPKGMREPLTAYALLPPVDEQPALSDSVLGSYDQALEATIEGRWDEAQRRLALLPADDGPTQFLQRQMLASGGKPPRDWDGAFALTSK